MDLVQSITATFLEVSLEVEIEITKSRNNKKKNQFIDPINSEML